MNLKSWLKNFKFYELSAAWVQKVFFLPNLSALSQIYLPFLFVSKPWQRICVSLPNVSAGDDQKLRLCAKLALHFNKEFLA